MRRALAPAFAAMLLAAGCGALTPAKPVPPPVAARSTPPDWFQQQLADARLARRSHMPRDDTAGAQAAYDGVVRAACVRVALSGPEKYQAGCATLLQRQAPANAAAPFACDEATSDPATLHACND